ncbi:hypothetical protein EZS27_029256, partial [termite gut metagenome]
MDSHAILCTRLALCIRNDGSGYHVQTFGAFKCRHSALHQLALLAMGDKT